jgi:hypothetical protein
MRTTSVVRCEPTPQPQPVASNKAGKPCGSVAIPDDYPDRTVFRRISNRSDSGGVRRLVRRRANLRTH